MAEFFTTLANVVKEQGWGTAILLILLVGVVAYIGYSFKKRIESSDKNNKLLEDENIRNAQKILGMMYEVSRVLNTMALESREMDKKTIEELTAIKTEMKTTNKIVMKLLGEANKND
jgi:cbb3-type cytochrome oxidase subunit 3